MLKIFNTLGRELQEFKPLEEGKVKMYQCGPTVYSRQHIGNMLSAVKVDLIRRSFDYLGYDVVHTRNITDVGHLSGDNEGDADTGEDRMEKGAKRENLTAEEIAKKYTDFFHQDIHLLNVNDPTYETPATSYINQMAEMVQELINKGFAYATEKAIYFEVDKFPKYNELNQQKLDQNIIGAGHGDEADSGKKKQYDFSIWFFKTGVHANALQTWKHKFSGINQQIEEGFPGWHIECSAMAKSTLDDQIDVHFGGVEHIPIHHTNEIAQSEAANGKKFTNYWLHHELLMVDGTKMSKSLGNVYSLDDLIERGFSPMDYRYFLLQAHYRSKQNFTWEALKAAKVGRERLVEQLRGIKKEAGDRSQESGEQSEHRTLNTEHFNKFKEALEADFNIPAALAVVWEVLKFDLSSEEKLELVLDFDRVLGLDLENELKQEAGVGSQEPVSPEIQELIEKRNQFRAEKKYQEADEIRDRLMNEFGVEVKDK